MYSRIREGAKNLRGLQRRPGSMQWKWLKSRSLQVAVKPQSETNGDPLGMRDTKLTWMGRCSKARKVAELGWLSEMRKARLWEQ